MHVGDIINRLAREVNSIVIIAFMDARPLTDKEVEEVRAITTTIQYLTQTR